MTWDPNPEPDISGYTIYSRQLGKSYAPELTVTNGTSGTIANLEPDVTYFFAVTALSTSGFESGFSDEIRHTVPPLNGLPRITRQPSEQIVSISKDVTFTVDVVGDGLVRYRWRHDGQNVPRANGPSLTLTNVHPSDAGFYDVVVIGVGGSLASQAVGLSVLDGEPEIVRQPVTCTATTGQAATFAVQVTDTAALPLGYLWRKGRAIKAQHVSDSFTDQFTLTNVQPSDAGYYEVVITNSSTRGHKAMVSSAVFLKVIMPGDSDGDTLPDAYELSHGLDPGNAADALQDADADHLSNRDEYLAGTDPRNAASGLRMERPAHDGKVHLRFAARPDKTYLVEYRDYADRGTWKRLGGVPAISDQSALARLGEVVDPYPPIDGQRFYRLVIPAASRDEPWVSNPFRPEYFHFEAEEGVLTAPMAQKNDALASGGQFIETATSQQGLAEFAFDAAGGDYIVWARCRAGLPSPGRHNSLLVAVDGTSHETWHLFYEAVENGVERPPTDWTWDMVSTMTGNAKSTNSLADPKVFKLSQGAHSLQFKGRETLTGLDRIVITSDLSYDPHAKVQ